MKKFAAILVVLALVLGSLGIISVNADAKYVDQDDYDGVIRGQALDIIQGDGADLYTPGMTGDFLSENKATVYGPYQTVSMRGWIGVEDVAISQFGYVIGDSDPVFSDDFFHTTEQPVRDAGGEYAQRFNIAMDVSSVTDGKVTIMPVVRLEDGAVINATFYQIYYSPKAPEVIAKPTTFALTEDRTDTPYNFNGHSSIGFRFNVPEGYKLNEFVIIQSPTWNGPGNGIGCIASIYQWVGDDYDESVDNDPLDVYEEENHKDCTNLTIEYEYIPAGDYVIELTDFTGNLGGWVATDVSADYADTFLFFVDAMENELPVHVKMSVIPDDNPPEVTEKPTKAPATEAPTEAPTEVSTEAPTEVPATDVPATQAPATDAPATQAPEATEGQGDVTPAEKKGGLPAGAIIGIVAGVVVVAAVVAGIIISKKKK